jgi:hypothetical protein
MPLQREIDIMFSAKRQRSRRLRIGLALLVAGFLGSCNFIETTATNPNIVPEASLDQLLTGIQVHSYYWSESEIARLAAMWTQQMAGTDRQFTILDQYVFTEEEADDEFSAIYGGGGLLDIRRATALAEAGGRRVYAGILKIHEAYLMGMGASVFGGMPYSEAVNPDIATPKLDPQADVYTAVQVLLDQAIADLQSGQGVNPGGVDFNFGGNAARWAAVAHTLRARYSLHWAEVRGQSAYQEALNAAQNGISEAAGSWRTIHSTAAPEQNLWHQFMRDRSGYISSGDYLLPFMVTRNDPRLPIYFSEAEDGGYVARSSSLSATGAGAANWNLPIVSCAENQFIIAESQYQLGNEGPARTAAVAGLACEEVALGVDLSAQKTLVQGLSGPELLKEIMHQKYTALFLNLEVWNDYKRTCEPAITPRGGKVVPGRLYYGKAERQQNPKNIPAPPAGDPGRNDNDPSAC